MNDDEEQLRGSSGLCFLPGLEKRKSRRTKQGQPTDQEVMLSVVQHRKVVSRVTERLLSGLRVEGNDWDALESSMVELGAFYGLQKKG